MLFAWPIKDNCSPFPNLLILALAWYRSSVPAPPLTRPKTPERLSAFRVRLMVGSVLPSSKPVNWLWSLFFSNTCTLLTISACRLRVASLGSVPKNSFPSTSTRFTSCPLALMLPSLSTSTPGNLFSRSSTTALGLFTLKLPALNSTVSPLMVTGAATTTTPSRVLLLTMGILPKSLSGLATEMVKVLLILENPV